MSIARAIAILGAGAAGYSSGEERARQAARQQEDDAFRREQRERQRTQWQRDDAEFKQAEADKQAERAAMAPTTMTLELTPEQQGPQGFQAGGKTFGDPNAAKAAADAYNAPQAGIRRAAAAVQNPMRAAELTGKANAMTLGNLQLDAAQREAINSEFRNEQAKAFQGGWESWANFLSKSGADGAGGKMKFGVSKEGGKVKLYQIGADGKPTEDVMTFDDNPEGMAEASMVFDIGTPVDRKLEHFRNKAKDKLARDDKLAYNARADKAEERRGVHEDRMYALALRQSAAADRAAARAGGAAPGPTAVLWDDKADQRVYDAATTIDPVTGAKAHDGAKADFVKQIGVVLSGKLGGDTLRAVGQAIDIDNQLRARADAAVKASGGKLSPDQAIRQERATFLNAGAPQQAGAKPAAGGPPATPAPAAVPQPRMAAVVAPFKADQAMEQALLAEQVEMGEGKRMKFSTPELAAYARSKFYSKQDPSADVLAERARALRLSRQQIGKF